LALEKECYEDKRRRDAEIEEAVERLAGRRVEIRGRRRGPVPPAVAAARRRRVWKSKYNLTEEDYETLLRLQGGACAICKEPPAKKKFLVVDHDHVSGEVRGLLCGRCNSGIGMLLDDVAVVRAALQYLVDFEIALEDYLADES
jgi:hypothetical protein